MTLNKQTSMLRQMVLAEAIREADSSIGFSLEGDTYETVIWEPGRIPPSKALVESKLPKGETNAQAVYSRQSAAAKLPATEEQLAELWSAIKDLYEQVQILAGKTIPRPEMVEQIARTKSMALQRTADEFNKALGEQPGGKPETPLGGKPETTLGGKP